MENSGTGLTALSAPKKALMADRRWLRSGACISAIQDKTSVTTEVFETGVAVQQRVAARWLKQSKKSPA
jgi:hypothetical protein